MATVFDKIQNSVESGPLEAASEQVTRRSETEKFSLTDPVALPGFSYAPLSSHIQVADLDPDPNDPDPSLRIEVSTEPPPFFLKFGKGDTDRLCIFHQPDKGLGWVESVDFDKELDAGPPPTLGFTVRSRDKDGKLNLERGTFEIDEDGEPINATFRGETKTLDDMRREYLVAREHRYSLEPGVRKTRAEEYKVASEALDSSLAERRKPTGYEFSQRTTERSNHALVDGKKVVAADTPLFVSSIGVLSSSPNIGFLSNDGDWEASPLSDHQKVYQEIPNNPGRMAWQNPPQGQGELERQLAALPQDIPIQDRNEVYRPSQSTRDGRTSYTFAHQYKGWRDYRDLDSGVGILHLPESSLPKEIAAAYRAAAEKGKDGMLVGEWIEHDGKKFAVQWDGKVVFDRGERKYEVWNPLEAMRATRNASAVGSPRTLESTYTISLTSVEGAHYEPGTDNMTLDIQTAKVESPTLAPIPDQSTDERTYDQWAGRTDKIPDVIQPTRPPEPSKTEVMSTLNENRQAFRTELAKFLGVRPMPDMLNPFQGRTNTPFDAMQLFTPGKRSGHALFGNLGQPNNPFMLTPRNQDFGGSQFRLNTNLNTNGDPFALMGVPASQYAAGPFLRWMPIPQSSESTTQSDNSPNSGATLPSGAPGTSGTSEVRLLRPLGLAPSPDVLKYLNPTETYTLQQQARQSAYDSSPSDLVFAPRTGNGQPGFVPSHSQFLSRGGVAVVVREDGGTHVVGKGSDYDKLKGSSLRELEKAGDMLFESIEKAKELVASGKMSEDELKLHTSGTMVDPVSGDKLAWFYQESSEVNGKDRIVVLRLNDMPEIIGPLVGSVVQSRAFDQWHEILIPKSGNVVGTNDALSRLRTGDSGFRFTIESRDSRSKDRDSGDLSSLRVPRISIRQGRQQSDSPFNTALSMVFPDSVDTRNGSLQPKDCLLIRARVSEDGRVTIETKDFDANVDAIPGMGTRVSVSGKDNDIFSFRVDGNTGSDHNRFQLRVPEQASVPSSWVYDALGETRSTGNGAPQPHWGSYDASSVYPRGAVPLTSGTLSLDTTIPRLRIRSEDNPSDSSTTK